MDPLAPTDSAWASIGVHGEPLGGNALASTESKSGRPSVILAEPSKLLAEPVEALGGPVEHHGAYAFKYSPGPWRRYSVHTWN